MNFWPFRRKDDQPAPPPKAGVIPFSGDLTDTATLKYHGVRALCGMLMDRHDHCRIARAHPFCGPYMHLKDDGGRLEVIAHVIPQGDESSPEPNLIGIYLCKGVNGMGPVEKPDPLEYTALMMCADTKPLRKMAVQPISDGSYHIRHGEILNPVDGDHSTGRLDTSTVTELRRDPEPAYTRWEYYDIQLVDGPLVTVPEFHCLQIRGEWWVVDVDKEKRTHQQLAALTVANNPDHARWGRGEHSIVTSRSS